MRNPEDMVRGSGPNRGMSRRTRTILLALAAVVVVVVFSARAIAGFFTDYLWFSSLGVAGVWRTRLFLQISLGAGFSALFALILFVNLSICDRLRSPMVNLDDELLNRYNELVGTRRRGVRIVTSVLFGLVAGVGASGQWNNYLLFRNGGSFGVKDPLHGRDLGFYVFKLPFISYLMNWAFAAAVIVLLVVGVSHYLNGGIRIQAVGQRFSSQVKAHLSVLLAVLAILKAADYFLQRYALVFSDRGVVEGATYTDVNAQLPALGLLVLISLLSATLFIVNIRRRGWTLPVVAISLWLLVALIAGEAYPWFIQSFQVKRKESSREAPYIARNIAATRTALGLDKVVENNFDYTTTPPASAVTDNPSTIRNIRLLDPAVVDETYNNLESQLPFYKIGDLDVDRYAIGPEGAANQVLIGTRELNLDAVSPSTWEKLHLIYTHGYGLALAPANVVTTKGDPNFLVGQVPVKTDASQPSLAVTRPEIYFGEGIDSPGSDYAIVKTKRKELSGSQEMTYAGKGGVSISGFFRRAAFFLRFGDLETLTSDYLTDQSRILYVRDVVQRVKKVAPFLSLDADPYPVLVDGRIQYIVDAYTTSSTYPYAQQADTTGLESTAELQTVPLNYIRNSVKAVVDAYDGSVSLYLVDQALYKHTDPIARAYAKAFPDLFKPFSAMDPQLQSHIRYPEDLFRIQTAMWGHYHITDPEDFYNAGDLWDVAQDAGQSVSTATTTGTTPTGDAAPSKRVDPYYLQMRLPKEKNDSFLLFRPFVPHSDGDSKKQLTSFMVAKSDPSDYGTLQVFTMTTLNADGKRERNRQVNGPLIVSDNIQSNAEVSKELTLLNSGGSKVRFGNLLVVPIDQGLLYVRPYYVSADKADALPELRRVVVAIGDRIALANTLNEALSSLFPDTNIPTAEVIPSDGGTPVTPGDGTTTPTVTRSPADLIADALALFSDADDALKTGGAEGLADYQKKTAEAEDLIRQAQAGLSVPAATSPTTTAPSGSPTTTKSTTTTTKPTTTTGG